MSPARKHSIVLLGATGYSGKLCAEYITKHLPTNLQWAVAGRSASKLQGLVSDLKKLNPDRSQPEILPVNLNKEELDSLARRTKVLLNCVGPYHLYSTPVVAACADNGTHYLDITGETPWVREMLQKYHETAKSNRAILIPEIGFESTPSDLMAFVLASTIRRSLNCGVRDVICTIHEMKSPQVSGGTLATVLGLLDHYSIAELRVSLTPSALSPAGKKPPNRPKSRSFLSRILGTFSHPDLGVLTTSIGAIPNEAVVHRSSGLMPQLYGDNFRYSEYMTVSNYAIGILVHLGIAFISLILAVKPFRSLIRKFLYQPGQGSSVDGSTKSTMEFRAIGSADQAVSGTATGGADKVQQAKAWLRYEAGPYYFTGLVLAEGAMVLLENQDLVDRLGGGLLTPACLGDKYVERLRTAGVQIEARMLL